MSVLLGTNVVSELQRSSPNAAVEGWVAERPAAELYFSAVGEAELRYGVAMLPAGPREDALAAAIEGILREDFKNQILPFNCDAARAYVSITAAHRAAGRAFAPADSQIAATARSRGLAVATHNFWGFGASGIEAVISNGFSAL